MKPLNTKKFANRHIGVDSFGQNQMLKELGYESLDQLIINAVPESILCQDLPAWDPSDEYQTQERLKVIANKNKIYKSLIGSGWNNCHTPAVIRRNIIENPAWYTSYTPYQPEISQGRLEMLLTFQTMVTDLTGCDTANASMLDEASAAAEAMLMLYRLDKSDKNTFFVDANSHPQTISVIKTHAEPLGIQLKIEDPTNADFSEDLFGVFITYPNTKGELIDLKELIDNLSQKNIRTAISTDLFACCLITPPGELGADIVLGSSQRFGVPLGFGGPSAAFFATKASHVRSLPGRLVGVSVDSAGRRALRLTLQTREQHIRREKATSNICTAQSLLANVAAAYAAWHGPEGLREIAEDIHNKTIYLASQLENNKLEIINDSFFDTFTIKTEDAQNLTKKAESNGFNLNLISKDTIGISLDETITWQDITRICEILTGNIDDQTIKIKNRITEYQTRTSDYLTHPNFNSYHSEHQMTRWLRSLSDKDLALDRSMIPLGSCTMKLNAAAELEPISWTEFANLHPYAPSDQTQGYRQLIEDLENKLAEITGYYKISLQPNAGSQGEFAGLMAIRQYHINNNQSERNICLIPASAHGTNAASAALAGMDIKIVSCDQNGNVDMNDLRNKVEEFSTEISTLMITYPSTHGVYEETVREICDLIHQVGGQVYTDGANLNALVGIAKPHEFGSDVSHFNLHKTFCIPHGGGGPGVGPIGVAEHLAEYLPGHPITDIDGSDEIVISSSAWGSASILPISWMYIEMMGSEELRTATASAVLTANYIASKLDKYFPVLYKGANNLVAHECIIDIRPITNETGVTNTDIAKRLADYGFHAPTMSFPVPGTLMIEPTESEDLVEIDRFIEAMHSIYEEINQIKNGIISLEASPLRNAPHTLDDLLSREWNYSYSREVASQFNHKTNNYFPAVSRINEAYGDKNLFCTCPDVSDFNHD